MSNFAFLRSEWPDLHEAATKAESLVYTDPRTACFYARRALEAAVSWLYKFDSRLRLPYQDNLSALIHEPSFKGVVGEAVFAKARVIQKQGNDAVHSTRPVRQYDALQVTKELFHLSYWLARTYARAEKPAASTAFNEALLPKAVSVTPQSAEQLQKLEQRLQEKDERLSELLRDKNALSEELKRLREEVAATKKANESIPDTHDYSEAQTRDFFIDLLLKEAGWPLDPKRDCEVEVTGMPNAQGVGYIDYVLWGDNGKPLAIIEAKRSRRDPREGQRQAELYADCLEKQYGQRPIIFYTNGYEHWIWDDSMYPPRQVQGFYKKGELEALIQRRSSRKALAEAPVNEAIVERYYQTRAIRRIGEAFEKDRDRKALVVMATGAGKTRTVIALCDLLMRCNWVKRVLFLADRVALVSQAVNAFKKHLPEASPVNLVTEKDAEGRVYVSTYPTMMRMIDETRDGQRRFGPGHFDLVIIDEAHRSVYQKYRAIFAYFDSLLVGLTATPRDEIDRDTYSLFDLERGVPTDAYDLSDAVKDKYLVPAKAVSVPLKFQREGIRYDDLSEEEKEEWDAKEWNEDGTAPDSVDAEAVNKWLFNADTVDKALAHLMTHGLKVAGGDRLGKTIIFAKNQAHADFIQERFDKSYPHLAGKFARVITFKTEYAQSLIDDFSKKESAPHIAISVDMLDTGIDVPEVVNLLFFKIVRSKTKFWQMVGRGTRLCRDLFGPGQDKEFFYIFDFCQNLEFFSQNPEVTEGSLGETLGKKLFKRRLELVREIDATLECSAIVRESNDKLEVVRGETLKKLQCEVAAMNVDNFVVRSKRRLVEKYSKPEAWEPLTPEVQGELANEIAGLPAELDPEDEEAKRFDLILLNLQLAVLRKEPSFKRLSDQVRSIAGLLEERSAIPMIREQLELIAEIQRDEWWEDVTVPMLEEVRRRLRLLVKFIEKQARKPVYTNFEDELGEHTEIELQAFVSSDSFERFREKTRAFLRFHQDHLTIRKLHLNEPLTPLDLQELERVLQESGSDPAYFEKAKEESEGLGLFVRSLIGLERDAAKKALGEFTSGSTLSGNQIEFVNLIIDQLTARGAMPPELLYQSPFTDIDPMGPDGVFSSEEVDKLIELLEVVRERALPRSA